MIVGQGLCGTLLSWYLQQEGQIFVVADNNLPNASSKVAAGVINPVTGRQYVTTWMIDELMAYAQTAYGELSGHLGMPLMQRKRIIEFFPTPDARNVFLEKLTENDTYRHTYPDQNFFNPLLNYDFGCGEISPAFTVAVGDLLARWRVALESRKILLAETFNEQEVEVGDEAIHYRGITARKIIFCDGVAAAQNKWFSLLPFSANKGEALIIECAGLPKEFIYKRKLTMVPMTEEGLFWIGSNYQFRFEDDQPSEAFYQSTRQVLNDWLKVPYKVVDHKAAVRPATVERRPFVGFHPVHRNVGILNGMGTKGASLAPFFAKELVQHLVHSLPITPQADVQRFSRILSRG